VEEPKRYALGRRYYDDLDVKWVKFLLHLKVTGMSIEELKQYVKLQAQGDKTIPERLELLANEKEKCLVEIDQIQNNLMILNRKMAWYEGKPNGCISVDEDFERYLSKFK
jgi:DNA-binding transcriptional MerR regulator